MSEIRQWVKLPSGRMINIYAFSYALPSGFETVNSQKLILYGLSDDFEITLSGNDAVFFYWYLNYMGSSTDYSGFDAYLEHHKNDKITVL
jgi:hypothetical protein